jgi:phosphoesterase RecJ-like protein
VTSARTRFPNTSARALRLAADLVERGASVAEIVRAVYEDQPPSAFRLLGRALAALELHAGGRVARCVIPLSMLDSAGAAAEESAGLVGVLRAIRGVRVALVVQEGAGVVYVSVRSREPARANAVAAALGGGGHPAAAGAEVDGTIDHVARLALDAAVREAERGGP